MTGDGGESDGYLHLKDGYLHLKDVSITSKAQPGDERGPAKRIRRLGAVLHDAELEYALASLRRGDTRVARAVSRDG